MHKLKIISRIAALPQNSETFRRVLLINFSFSLIVRVNSFLKAAYTKFAGAILLLSLNLIGRIMRKLYFA
jgi:hypothetical protein